MIQNQTFSTTKYHTMTTDWSRHKCHNRTRTTCKGSLRNPSRRLSWIAVQSHDTKSNQTFSNTKYHTMTTDWSRHKCHNRTRTTCKGSLRNPSSRFSWIAVQSHDTKSNQTFSTTQFFQPPVDADKQQNTIRQTTEHNNQLIAYALNYYLIGWERCTWGNVMIRDDCMWCVFVAWMMVVDWTTKIGAGSNKSHTIHYKIWLVLRSFMCDLKI
jgi:predicted Fe-S protein YdhL (DUF1289 family)